MMLRIAAFAVGFAAAKEVQLTWSDCSRGKMHLQGVGLEFSANPFPCGKRLKVTATGTLDEQVTDGEFDVSAKLGFIPVGGHKGSICGITTFTDPVAGDVTVNGVDCTSTQAGAVSISLDVGVPANPPDATLKIRVQGKDQAKAGLFCVDVVAKVVDEEWEQWKQEHGRTYESSDEEDYRQKVFRANIAFIESENMRGKSYKLGTTDFTDLTFDEFRSRYLTGYAPQKQSSNLATSTFQAPAGFVAEDSVDWVAKGAVTPIKNQAHCGSCWSFSTTGALEGAAFLAGRGLMSLSEQMILDCDRGLFPWSGGHGCKGGSMAQAMGWVKSNGLCSEADVSYKCADESSAECTNSQCPTSCTQVLKPGDVTGYQQVSSTENALEAAVAQQPVSIAIEADQQVFQHYKSGVLTDDACGESLDHGVLIVGYGVEDGTKYWKVKNSWGATWGDHGYIRIERGATESGGECGIRSQPVFPNVKAARSEVIV